MLMELLARETKLDVTELTRNQRPRTGTIFITPPNRHVELKSGWLTVRTPKIKSGPQPSVDILFSSLAVECGEQSTGVVFSGTGSDGARGVQAIKAAGGITFAQDETAKYNGMPNAAIATGCVDLILQPAEVARRIPHLHEQSERQDLLRTQESAASSDTYMEICAVIRTHTSVDFTNYRSSTILRRLSRRMAVLHLQDLDAYLALLNRDPSEIDRVVREFLIGVTSFFRDPKVWEAMKAPIEKLILAKDDREPVRIWIPGCASGEEAYTIAILVAEATRRLSRHSKVQIFASDLDADALAVGRRGLYPLAAAEQLDPQLLERYFTQIGDTFSINQNIREMIVFSRHNLAEDPPFSRVDMISCRNLFIYFTPELQRRVLERFRYALKRGGILVLGKSESVSEQNELFSPLDNTNKIFRVADSAASPFQPSAFTPLKDKALRERDRPIKRPHPWEIKANAAIAKHFGPPTIIVDESNKPIHIAGAIKPYLQVPTGISQFDVFSLIDGELRAELRALLLRSRRENVIVRSRAHIVEFEGDKWQYRTVVHPYQDDDTGETFSLIGFVTTRALLEQDNSEASDDGEQLELVKELEHEILAMREHLHTMVDELETSNEELQSLNEELQSANEELQSTNEELETSNEELQSTNEELTTVNEEIIVKSDALNEANSFQSSILKSIGSAVIVTDRDLRIQRFNAAATKIFELENHSIGELFAAVKCQFRVPNLLPLMEGVVQSGKPRSKRVRDKHNDRYYSLQVHPCLDEQERIIGVILMLSDVSQLSKANATLRQHRSELAEEMLLRTAILDITPAQIAVLDKTGKIIVVNEAWREFGRQNGAKNHDFGVGDNYLTVCENPVFTNPVESDEASSIASELRSVLTGLKKHSAVRYACHSPDEERWFKCVMRAAPVEHERIGALLLHINITGEVKLEQSMETARKLAEEASFAKSSFLANMSHELRTPLNAIIGFSEMISSETYGRHSHPKYNEYGRDIGSAADHLLRMINHILDLSKIESGRLELDEDLIDVSACQRAAFKLFEHEASLQTITLTKRFPKLLPHLVADRGAINQILINLIGNAVKFSKPGGRVCCSAKVNRDTGGLVLEVADKGSGIPAKELRRITEPFAQVRSTLTSNNSGVGLGLSLVKRLAQLHQATVTIDSEVGKGTKVAIVFPPNRVKELAVCD